MILTQISYIDCVVFLIFLAPQLLLNVDFVELVTWVLHALPHIVILIPYQFVQERFFTPWAGRSPFVQRATPFQDFVIRCVRYAFACMPAYIGRVFFSKPVALPFLRWRMLRHGYLHSPISWRDVKKDDFHGVWLTFDEETKPDIVVLYCHGGGFSMGSSYFYMEFLLAWVSLLKEAGYKNPALLALEYTLVPDAVYPTQVQQAFAAYEHVLSITEDPARICVGGDSAGGTLILSLLLYIANHPRHHGGLPALATMISPWVTLVSPNNRNTASDYLNSDSLHLYGKQYVGNKISIDDPMVSPGNCTDLKQWARATPSAGWCFLYGSEEVLGPEIRELVRVLKKGGALVDVEEEEGGIHAWPVASLYLGETGEERLKGLQHISKVIRKKML